VCKSLELSRAPARRDALWPSSLLELLSPDGSIDLANPLVRSLPVSTLAIGVAVAAIRGDRESQASAAVSDLEASLTGEIGASEAQP
jgi:hypothetical protein